MSSQFPEFVSHMQSKLAERILLSAEIECINDLFISGTLPEGLAMDLKRSKYAQIRKKRETPERIFYIKEKDQFKKVNVFKTLPKAELLVIKNFSQEKIVNDSHYIISQGENSRYIYFLTRGIIEITVNKEDSTSHIASLFPGNFFSSNKQSISQYNYIAATPCVILYFKITDLKYILNRCPEFKNKFENSLENRENLFELENRHIDK